jgi:hypothetical protein
MKKTALLVGALIVTACALIVLLGAGVILAFSLGLLLAGVLGAGAILAVSIAFTFAWECLCMAWKAVSEWADGQAERLLVYIRGKGRC